jgi:hypothetical protein
MTGVLDFLNRQLTEKEIERSEKEADLTIQAFKALQSSIKKEVERIMEEDGLKFTDICKKLDTSDRMTNKLIKGGSVNFETISQVSILNGKIPRIVWEEPTKKIPA